jgi:Holliday junction resolvase
MRLASKVDSTHASIRDGLRKAGFSVFDTSKLGAGFVDLVVGKWGQTYLVEVKTPRGRKTALQRLGAAQAAFRDTWNGGPVIAAYSLQDAIYAVNMHLKRTGWVK